MIVRSVQPRLDMVVICRCKRPLVGPVSLAVRPMATVETGLLEKGVCFCDVEVGDYPGGTLEVVSLDFTVFGLE